MVTNSNAGCRRRVVASYESLDHGGNNRGLVAPEVASKWLLCNFPLLWLVCWIIGIHPTLVIRRF